MTAPAPKSMPPVDLDWQRRLTVAEYHQMIDHGVFDEDEKLELLEGVLVAMSPQEPPHIWAITYLNRLLVRSLDDRFFVRPQGPLTLARSEPEPDLAVTDATRKWRRHPETAWLVVEVADTSLRKDRGLKSAIYAEASVAEYWVVNLVERCVEVFTTPDPAALCYRATRTVRSGETLRASSLSGVELPVAALFDRPDALEAG